MDELTAEEGIMALVNWLTPTLNAAQVLDHLRTKTEYTEQEIKGALDGYPYCVDTDVRLDGFGNRLAHGYDIRNFYDGNLIDLMLTTWTYWDEKQAIVKDMTIDDGIGIKKRTIVHHRANGEPESVETMIIEPAPSLGERLMGAVAGIFRG